MEKSQPGTEATLENQRQTEVEKPSEQINDKLTIFADNEEKQKEETLRILESVLEQNNEEHKLLRSVLEQNNEEHKLLRSVLEQVSQERSQLQSQLLESLQSNVSQLQNEVQELKKEGSQLQSKIDEMQAQISSLLQNSITPDRENSSDQIVTPNETEKLSPSPHSQPAKAESPQTPVALNLDPLEKDLVNTYNKEPKHLEGYTTEVSETQDSIEERRLGHNQPAVFEKVRNGTYWILTVQDRKYLVPKGGMKFNQNNYQTAQSLFQFQGYQPGVSSDFQLLKPGKVSPVASGDKWELIDRGVLQFE